MYLKLRIFFTILSALCLAAAIPVGVFFGFGWAGLCGFCALLFFGVMLLCKQSQEMNENKEQAKPADFFEPDGDKKDE